jgi:hypothetical protein
LLAEKVLVRARETKVAKPRRYALLSCAVVGLALFSVVNIAWGLINPLRLVNPTRWSQLRQNYIVAKLSPILEAPNAADVLLLGSSLTLAPAMRCDDAIAHRPRRVDLWYWHEYMPTYAKANYLQQTLSRMLHRDVQVQNASVIASVVSDQELILRRYLESKKPACVVLCTAPRDYIDPNCPPDKTSTYQFLANGDDLLDLASTKNLWSNGGLETLWIRACGLYRHRAELTALVQQCCADTANTVGTKIWKQKWNHIATTADEVPNVPQYASDETKVAWRRDIDHYRKMYFPMTDEQYDRQMRALRQLLSLCKSDKVPIVLVDMPLTKDNLALLPQEFKTKLLCDIEKTAKDNGVTVYKPNDDIHFGAKDFEDSAHLSSAGGFKFFDWLAGKVSARI